MRPLEGGVHFLWGLSLILLIILQKRKIRTTFYFIMNLNLCKIQILMQFFFLCMKLKIPACFPFPIVSTFYIIRVSSHVYNFCHVNFCLWQYLLFSMFDCLAFPIFQIVAAGSEPILKRFSINGTVLSQIQCAPQSVFSIALHPSGVCSSFLSF